MILTLWNLWSAHRQNPRKPITSTNHNFLEWFPAEIWLKIASLLSPISTVNLALSCHYFAFLVKYQRRLQLQCPRLRFQRIEFLRCLEINYPRALLCSSCVTFHTRKSRWSVFDRRERLNPKHYRFAKGNCIENSESASILRKGDLDWWLVQLVMRYSRFGPAYGVRLFTLRVGVGPGRSGYWAHNTFAAIVNGRLLIKIISQVLFHARPDFRYHCKAWQDKKYPLPTCNHLEYSPSLTAACWSAISSQDMTLAPTARRRFCSRLYRCQWCPSEYQVECRLGSELPGFRIGRKDSVLMVSRWVDIGDGSSPQCPEWAGLVRLPSAERRSYEPFDFGGLTTVRSRFKNTSHNRIPLESTSDVVVAYTTCNDLPDHVSADLQSLALGRATTPSPDWFRG